MKYVYLAPMYRIVRARPHPEAAKWLCDQVKGETCVFIIKRDQQGHLKETLEFLQSNGVSTELVFEKDKVHNLRYAPEPNGGRLSVHVYNFK